MPSKAKKRNEPRSGFLAFGLGSNLGESEAILCWAIEELDRLFGRLVVAPLYRSTAISPVAQPDFLNTVALRTWPPGPGGAAEVEELGPEEILALAKALEMRAGRRRGIRHGPRRLDVDLLLCGEHCLERPELTLPHPRMRQRRFVLEPLAELAPALRLPPDGAAVTDLLRELGSDQPLGRIGWSRPPAGVCGRIRAS
ncbi:MAG: 2-amino-4-hydroxy-6-hydroxymethyldihydropteridine diphosphokinase [bacterium]|nr:2-amino-4-hydroxy-6-hydroxymethyldihydropteridine diphosphokinase [bacterium]